MLGAEFPPMRLKQTYGVLTELATNLRETYAGKDKGFAPCP